MLQKAYKRYMRRLIQYALFFSLMAIQFHGLSHTLVDEDHTQHNCVICELQTHSPGIEPGDNHIKISSPFEFKLTITPSVLVFKTNLLVQSSPRAPPLFS